MKALKLFTLLVLVALLGVSCGSSSKLGGSSSGDDIYYNPSQDAKGQVASASNGKHVTLDKSYRDLINETNNALVDTLYMAPESDSTGNPYQDVLADSYEKARRNRDIGRNDPWNGVSSNAAYSQNMWYATAYDPAFYNVIVMGNTIWAEPKYVSSMFGYPYNSPYVNFGSYYSPYRNSWNVSFGIGMSWGFGNNWGWGYDPYWGYPYNSYYGGGWGGYSHGGYYQDMHPSYTGRGYRDVVYGPRDGGMRSGTSSIRNNSSRGYSYSNSSSVSRTREDGSGVVNSNRGTTAVRRDAVGSSQTSRDYQSTPARRSSSSSYSPVRQYSRDAYTPTYSRPARSGQPVFNEGSSSGTSRTYERRTSTVVAPRVESSSYDNSRSYPSRGTNSSYTPSRSNNSYNSGSSSTYTPSRSTSSSPASSSSSSSSSSSRSTGSEPTRGRR